MKIQSYIIIAFLSLFIISCGSKKNIVNSNKKRINRTNKQISRKTTSIKKMLSVNQNAHIKKLIKKKPQLNKYTLTYIKRYAPLAVIKMHEFKIPASITLAQGILESGNGRSILSSKSNNHFGIKCHRGWSGKRVYHDDDKKDDCFRKYEYVESSYNDHSKFLTERNRYAFLFKYRINDYKKWAKGLKKAGYATDKKYPFKLIRIIEDYKLYEFDKVKKRDLKNYKKQNNNLVEPSYIVEEGDTLYSISKKVNVTVSEIKRLNNLKNSVISIGQRLKLK